MKKKLLTLGLSSTLALSSVMPAFANSIAPNVDKTYIETAIGFKYPETISSLKEKNLKATLKGPVNLSIDLNAFLQNPKHSDNIGGYNVISESIIENGKITVLKFTIQGLDAKDGYTLQIEGKNYVSTVVNLSTANYSKRVNIGTDVNMLLGDVNKDNKVDASDRKILEDNLNANNLEYDLNNDGKITVSDIAIVNSNMKPTTPVKTFDTEIVASKVIKNINSDKFNNITNENGSNISEIKGNLENIFNNSGSISFKAKEKENNISIPLEFNKPQEMSSIEVKIPVGADDAQVILYDENDKVISTSIEEPNISTFTSMERNTSNTLTRESNNKEKVVVVNLGSRRPVKKITINVVPNKDNEYVVLEEVKIIGDIVNENIIQDNTVKDVKAMAGSEEVTLSWKAVPNVTGYKVYYGKSADNLDNVVTTDITNIKISNLKNLQTYYFCVSATSGDWESNKSEIVSATPQPEQAPNRPDFVKGIAGDGIISLNWKNAKNAKTYNIYIKTKEDSAPKKVKSGITNTSYNLTGLTNDVEYTVYVTSQNSVGESSFSEPVQATPKREVIVIPTLPTKDRISNDNIEKVEMFHPHYADETLHPNGFDPKLLIDEDFYTSWVARSYQEVNAFTFTFKEPKTMDYLIWVPKLNGNYRNANLGYTIKVWTEDNINGNGTVISNKTTITERFENNSYYAFTFPKTENIKKIYIQLHETPGSIRVNASEVAFYDYNNLPDRIDALFANGSRTKLANNIKQEQIDALRAEVNTVEGFVVDRNILLKELDIAQSLLNKNEENLGFIKDNVFSINPEEDNKNFGKAINNWQPLGLVGIANEKVAIYADIPEGESVSLVPTQFFEQADSLYSSPITLKNGRNIITIPKIGNVNRDRGGSLYITYSGKNPSDVKLQVIGAHKIPYLELKDLYSITPEKAKERISKFVEDLTNYIQNGLKGNLEINPLNHTEISLPNVLLSLPATKVLEGINKDSSTLEDKTDKMYKNVLAWEELLDVIYQTYGIDDHKQNSLQTRNNIRYMKMFADAFMYASGNHIGVPYDSAYGLMNGKPISELNGQDQNNLFGWGIAHEIGHVMDKLGKAEVTNNIYSLMVQTYDGNQNILKSRIELNDGYDRVFKKVSDGKEGLPNDGLTHLAMYWQLHLAYDNGDNPFNFYNRLHKEFRNTSLSDMNQFAMAASKIANKDLTEFFTRWGVSLSDEAKSNMAQYSKEDRAIYYLTDESRRARLNGTQDNKNVDVDATAKLQNSQDSKNDKAKEVIITINNKDDSLQGYEILRKGSNDKDFKPIGFTKTNTYVDYIGSANNLTFTYAIRPIDILGNPSPIKTINQVRISYDNTIEKSLYTIDENQIVTFKEPTIVTGIKVTPKSEGTQIPNSGNYKVFADIVDNISQPPTANEDFVLAKNGDFANNFATTPNTYISYFNKPNSSEDKIWAYDVTKLKLEGFDTNNYNIEFLSYPGDNVEFMEMGIGRLSNDYKYGENSDDFIPKDSLVIVGKYRGNSVLSNVYIKGIYSTQNPISEESKIEERPVGGYTLMFDTLDEDGTITSSTAEGIFIFVPQIQGEGENKGYESISDLPIEIMAEMWQGKFNEDGSFTKERLTSDTTWVSMPTDESLPTIVLQGGKKDLKVDFK
ncbi:M60 family metallopeptidase [uncultured Tyzzerella sp.]|uniref:M60 family metallopeptidase n=1 Tax=uncultured Tyzzerella sp. TaxID=2321398 RepID=UPI00294219ED|nr:M60 family metallopeptidase [uncultured Tyzzerella sp.]